MKEDTKERKIKLSSLITVFLLITILVIVIIILITFVLNLNKNTQSLEIELEQLREKIALNDEVISNNDDELKRLKEENKKYKDIIVDELGEEYIEVHDFFDASETSKTNNINYSKDIDGFSDEQIKDVINSYFDLETLYYNSKESFLIELDLATRGEISKYQDGNMIGDEFYPTDIKYEDYKNKLLEYMTEECFYENFTDEMKNKDGYLYYSYVTASDPREYEIKGIEKVEKNTFEVSVAESIYEYNYEIDDYEKTEEFEEDKYIFELVSNDGKLLVQFKDYSDNYNF